MNNIELLPDAKSGTRVVLTHPTFAFTPEHIQNGREHLTSDGVYTVRAIEGNDDTAAVELEEFIGVKFALTQFDELET